MFGIVTVQVGSCTYRVLIAGVAAGFIRRSPSGCWLASAIPDDGRGEEVVMKPHWTRSGALDYIRERAGDPDEAAEIRIRDAHFDEEGRETVEILRDTRSALIRLRETGMHFVTQHGDSIQSMIDMLTRQIGEELRREERR